MLVCFYLLIAQIALDPPPSVKRANVEKKVLQTNRLGASLICLKKGHKCSYISLFENQLLANIF